MRQKGRFRWILGMTSSPAGRVPNLGAISVGLEHHDPGHAIIPSSCGWANDGICCCDALAGDRLRVQDIGREVFQSARSDRVWRRLRDMRRNLELGLPM